MNVNPISSLKFQIAVLQLEEYDLSRFIKRVSQSFLNPPRQLRKPIVWTAKLKLVSGLATVLLLVISGGVSWLILPDVFYLTWVILSGLELYFFYVYVSLAVLVLSPADWLTKSIIIWKAKQKISHYPHVKIVGIAGSYGKTTMKEIVTTILKQKFQVLSTPENINTPLGISRLIQKSDLSRVEILVVEMGEYQPGDIKNICGITKPDIAIITGINEAHLERMGNLNKTAGTIFEVADNLKNGGLLLANADDDRVVEYANTHLFGNMTWFSSHNVNHNVWETKNIQFAQDGSGITFELDKNQKKVDKIKIPILAEYGIGDVLAGVQLAENVGMKWHEMRKGIDQITVVPHRLFPITNSQTKVLVIDDSYNGNPDGVREAISVLSKFHERRKLYVTPGLVEAGDRVQEVHEEIGKKLAKVANIVVLIKNSVTPIIAQGLIDSGFDTNSIYWYESGNDVQKHIGEHVRPGDVVLFQNDWPDNYA